jgi:hypothetical protein
VSASDAERLRAGLDADEATVQHSGSARVAWLTYHNDVGGLLYTTVAADGEGDWDVWAAGGNELPEPASVRVVYDPARERRDIAAKRRVLALYEEFAAIEDPDPIADAIAGSLGDIVATLAGVYEEAEVSR